jgi:predicted nucleic acid-binding protein
LSPLATGHCSSDRKFLAKGRSHSQNCTDCGDLLQEWLEVDVRSWHAGRILPVTESIAERWGHLAVRAKQQGFAV